MIAVIVVNQGTVWSYNAIISLKDAGEIANFVGSDRNDLCLHFSLRYMCPVSQIFNA